MTLTLSHINIRGWAEGTKKNYLTYRDADIISVADTKHNQTPILPGYQWIENSTKVGLFYKNNLTDHYAIEKRNTHQERVINVALTHKATHYTICLYVCYIQNQWTHKTDHDYTDDSYYRTEALHEMFKETDVTNFDLVLLTGDFNTRILDKEVLPILDENIPPETS